MGDRLQDPYPRSEGNASLRIKLLPLHMWRVRLRVHLRLTGILMIGKVGGVLTTGGRPLGGMIRCKEHRLEQPMATLRGRGRIGGKKEQSLEHLRATFRGRATLGGKKQRLQQPRATLRGRPRIR